MMHGCTESLLSLLLLDAADDGDDDTDANEDTHDRNDPPEPDEICDVVVVVSVVEAVSRLPVVVGVAAGASCGCARVIGAAAIRRAPGIVLTVISDAHITRVSCAVGSFRTGCYVLSITAI